MVDHKKRIECLELARDIAASGWDNSMPYLAVAADGHPVDCMSDRAARYHLHGLLNHAMHRAGIALKERRGVRLTVKQVLAKSGFTGIFEFNDHADTTAVKVRQLLTDSIALERAFIALESGESNTPQYRQAINTINQYAS